MVRVDTLSVAFCQLILAAQLTDPRAVAHFADGTFGTSIVTLAITAGSAIPAVRIRIDAFSPTIDLVSHTRNRAIPFNTEFVRSTGRFAISAVFRVPVGHRTHSFTLNGSIRTPAAPAGGGGHKATCADVKRKKNLSMYFGSFL
jgi:hypothetical protein